MLMCHPYSLVKNFVKQRQGPGAPSPHRIVYCYSAWQDAFEENQMRNLNFSSNTATLEFTQGLPDLTDFDSKKIIYLYWTI